MWLEKSSSFKVLKCGNKNPVPFCGGHLFPLPVIFYFKMGRKPWGCTPVSPVCCHSCIPVSLGPKYWGSRNWEWKFLAMLMKTHCSYAVFWCECTWVLEKSGIYLLASVPWNAAYVRRRTVKIFFFTSDSNSVRAEQAQLVTAGTNRIGSSDPNVGLHIVPGRICMTSTEDHLVACMLWEENSSYKFFSTVWDALGKMCLALTYKSQGELTPRVRNLRSKNPVELHCLFKEAFPE